MRGLYSDSRLLTPYIFDRNESGPSVGKKWKASFAKTMNGKPNKGYAHQSICQGFTSVWYVNCNRYSGDRKNKIVS
jgi:hypothetical protein